MDSYNDISRFMNKLGESHLTYRNFTADKDNDQTSRWNLLNEVATYHEKDFRSSPTAADKAPAQHTFHHHAEATRPGPVPSRTRLTSVQSAPPDMSQPARGFGHIFRQAEAADASRDKTASTPLKALLKRIGS